MNLSAENISLLFLKSFFPILALYFIVFYKNWLSAQSLLGLLVLTIITPTINIHLKNFFQVPLAPHLPQGFAFPSGHMQYFATFVTFFLTYASGLPRYVKLNIIFLAMGYGISLVNCRFHDYVDIWGAIVVSIMVVSFYRWISLKIARNYLGAHSSKRLLPS